jgi:para-aminobenzoate synthetase component I
MLIREFHGSVDAETLLAAFGSQPYGFLLDSARSSSGRGRYCFAGAAPFLVFRAFGSRCEMTDASGQTCVESGDPWEKLRALLARYRFAPPRADIPFFGGAVGYFSYEAGSALERVAAAVAAMPGEPDMVWGFYDAVVVLDALERRCHLVASEVGGRDPETLLAGLETRLAGVPRPAPVAQSGAASAPRSDFSRTEFEAAVQRVREYIAAGDVYQVNLAQRFSCGLPCAPVELYRRLRARTPAPYGAFLNFPEQQIASASPELFLELRGRRLVTRPIKGTRPRGHTGSEDAALAEELLQSEKDRAELLMIVDLERNDLGRVCRPGSVRVDELRALEDHPTVWHTVAEVSGELAAGADAIDAILAAFPGGSITGAPKVRAMQIIAELERARRGVYTGAIGYLGFDGDVALNIAIRTIVCHDGLATYHVGGGMVWDSDPAAEYEETLAKGRALHEALTTAT